VTLDLANRTEFAYKLVNVVHPGLRWGAQHQERSVASNRDPINAPAEEDLEARMDDSGVFWIVFILFLFGLIAAGLVFIFYQNIKDGKRIDELIKAQQEEEAIQARARWEENQKAIAEAKALEAIDRQRFPQKWANIDRMKAREARWAAKNARDRAEVEAEEAKKQLQSDDSVQLPRNNIGWAERALARYSPGYKPTKDEQEERDDAEEFLDMMFDEESDLARYYRRKQAEQQQQLQSQWQNMHPKPHTPRPGKLY
jgi:hypothetical protein